MNQYLTPKEIVIELNKHIIGQNDAKKAVAIALRNRWRRMQVASPLKEDIVPKNILMMGPTGVGKTEIARRLAKLADAPFIKVEATKFTEVGYVGRDVESIIRDLVDISIHELKEIKHKEVRIKAESNVEERILDSLVGKNSTSETREKFRNMLKDGKLDEKEIEIEVSDTPSNISSFDIPGMPGSQLGVLNLSDIVGNAFGSDKTKIKKMLVSEARKVLTTEESNKLIDDEKIVQQALARVQNDGIVFIDEIDKIIANNENKGAQVSREGVQRDLLPLIEGTTVNTKHGAIKTDHILFISSGAFHLAKPSDLLPELQGRLPIRVELSALNQEDMVSILKEPETSLLKQYTALLKTENIALEFKDDGIIAIAKLAIDINQEVENIGARRLHTILEKLLEEISYNSDSYYNKSVIIDSVYVHKQLDNLTTKTDLSKFIL